MSCKVDLSRFKTLVRDLSKARGKPLADMLNKGLLTAVIGSSNHKGLIQMTPKATKSKIKADLRRNKLNIKLSVRALKQEGFFAARRSRAEIQQKIAAVSDARLMKRDISRAYIAAGWIRSARDLGFGIRNIRARTTKLWDGGTAAQGYGVTAKSNSLRAEAYNMSRGADVISGPFMQQAINNACEDMADYFRNKGRKILESLGLRGVT